MFRRAEPVMGTVVSFDLRPGPIPAVRVRAALRAACASLHDADRVFSLYRPDSPLQRIRDGRLTLDAAPAEIPEVLSLCATARELSGGWFDPWALSGGVDPTGLVKGWAAERAAAILRGAGIAAAMVNAAGDVITFGRPEAERPWRIGVRSPAAPDQLFAVVETDGAVATSGQYERPDHVIDPHTGLPARAALSATVCGPSLTIADALATGLLAAGRTGLAAVRAAGYEALLVDPSGELMATAGFPVAAPGLDPAPARAAAGPRAAAPKAVAPPAVAQAL